MNNIKACRVCLATEVKFYYLGQHPLLETYFEPIIGRNPLCLVDLPMYACYECAAYIKKFYFFREKCLKGQATYYDILQKHGELTINEIKQVDRLSLNLSSNLVIKNTVETDKLEFKDTDHEAVKNEIDSFNTVEDLDLEVQTEDDIVNISSPTPAASLSDDEPVSVNVVKEKQNIVATDPDNTDNKVDSDIKLELQNIDHEPVENGIDSFNTVEDLDLEVQTEDDIVNISSPTPAASLSDDERVSVNVVKEKQNIVATDPDNTDNKVDSDIKLELQNIDHEPVENEIDSFNTFEYVNVKTEDDIVDISSSTPAASSDDELVSVRIVKEEQNIVATDSDNTGHEVDIDIKLELKDTDNESVRNEIDNLDSFDTIENLEVKTEDDFVNMSSPTPAASSSDDEPLSVHVTKKELNKEESSSLSEFPAVEVRHRKRGRSKKAVSGNEKSNPRGRKAYITDGMSSEEESDIYQYVDVVQLTVEEQIDEIIKRKESSNYINAQYKCDLCYKGFIDTSAWKHHVENHAGSAGDFECPICKFRFKGKRILKKHASNHKCKFSCKSCPYISKTETQAKRHQKWHKGVTYKCQYCDEVFTKWTSYLSHVRNKHPSEFICSVCGYSFLSKISLHLHKTMMHKDVLEEEESEEECKEKDLYCSQCDVQFTSVEVWKRHMVTSVKHNQNLHFSNECRVCGETFKSAEEVRVHHRKEHARKRPRNYGKKPSNMVWPSKCEHCDEEIPSAREYWPHFRREHPEKKDRIQSSYTCEICGKSFSGNASLTYHKRTHSEERAYKCNQCPKEFSDRTTLKMHEKTHSDHRPHTCIICSKSFKFKTTLDRHFMGHPGVKPHECGFCSKRFTQTSSRNLHLRRVHLKISTTQSDTRSRLDPGLWVQRKRP